MWNTQLALRRHHQRLADASNGESQNCGTKDTDRDNDEARTTACEKHLFFRASIDLVDLRDVDVLRPGTKNPGGLQNHDALRQSMKQVEL